MSLTHFVAIDFETANHQRSSVCSMGLVVVQGGQIVHEAYHLIRPTPNHYHYMCARVHGLGHADTDKALTFPEVWALESSWVKGVPFVAHNASFDQSCLRAVHRAYAMPYPEYPFLCTCVKARSRLASQVPNHKLPTVAAYLGVDMGSHHHALDDARACALIALKLFAS